MEEFIECFAEVADPRRSNARHDLYEVLMIALCTILCGGEDCSDMVLFGQSKERFLRGFLRLHHGIPSHDTFSRIFRLLDPVAFEACFTRFMQRFARGLQGVIAIDGKTLRRSFDRASGQSPLHMVHAWSVDQRLLLGQLAVEGKSNEITAVPKLLQMLSLRGCVVTGDAMNCQRATAATAIAQGADYVLALKANQPTLHDDVRTFLEDPERAVGVIHRTVDGEHGRIETRTSEVCKDIDWLQKSHDWPGLAAIGKVARIREKDGAEGPSVRKRTVRTGTRMEFLRFWAESRNSILGPARTGCLLRAVMECKPQLPRSRRRGRRIARSKPGG
jgi:predicted transposase YbfD/YdcC